MRGRRAVLREMARWTVPASERPPGGAASGMGGAAE